MNAPTPALLAPRPERLRLVGQRRQMLAVMHQRLMFGMLVYAGIVALIALRILWLAAFGDHAGRKEGLTSLVPDRGDIVDRDGQPLARTIDAWTIAIHPTKVIGDKLALTRQLAQLMPERSEEQYFAMLRSGRTFFYLRRRGNRHGYPHRRGPGDDLLAPSQSQCSGAGDARSPVQSGDPRPVRTWLDLQTVH